MEWNRMERKVDIKLECLDNLTDLLKRFGREVESEVGGSTESCCAGPGCYVAVYRCCWCC